jgi:hypothetical protein
MYLVKLPNNQLYVTPEQLPRMLANLAETHYVDASGRYLQTTTEHGPVVDSSLATLLVKNPFEAAVTDMEKYQGWWLEERAKNEALSAKLERLQQKGKKKRSK